MNKFAAHGLIAAAVRGDHILVVCWSQRAAREAFDVFAPLTVGLVVRRGVGAERIDTEVGGYVRFTTYRALHLMRGSSADVVYVDNGVYLDDETRHNLSALIATSDHGELVRADR